MIGASTTIVRLCGLTVLCDLLVQHCGPIVCSQTRMDAITLLMRTIFLFCLGAVLCGASLGCQSTSPANSTTGKSGQSQQSVALNRADQQALETRRREFVTAPDFVERLDRLLELEQQALAWVSCSHGSNHNLNRPKHASNRNNPRCMRRR